MNTFFTILKKPLVHTIGLLQVLLLCFSVGVKAQTTPYRPLSDTHSDGGLLCVGTFTSGESKAYDLDPNSYATLQNDVGLACFAEETVQFGQTAKAGDSILVYLGTGGGLLDATLLANATLQAKNSGTNVGSPIALNSALLNLQLLSGGTKALVKFPVSGNTNQIQIKAGGLLSLLVTLRIYDIQLKFENPTVVGGLNKSICSGQSTTVTTTTTNGTTLDWYDVPSGGIALQSNTNSFTTPIITVDKIFYIQVNRAGGGNEERLPVKINVINPSAPIVNSINICSGSATTLSVSSPKAGETYNWYSAAAAGSLLGTGSSFTTPVLTSNQSYYVETAQSSCISASRTQVDVTVNALPAPAVLQTSDVTINANQTASLEATAGTGEVVDWYDSASGGTLLHTGSPFVTPALNTTTTYYAVARNSSTGCSSTSRQSVTVQVNAIPSSSCLQADTQNSGISGVLCVLCSVQNPGYSVDNNSSNYTQLNAAVGVLASVYQRLVFPATGIASDSISLDLELPSD
ncbi:immunoglobulin domain-containing protein, partial [Solitalea koreensis]